MFSRLKPSLPSWQFLLLITLFWLILNGISANSYWKRDLQAGNDVSYWAVYLWILPYFIHWIWITIVIHMMTYFVDVFTTSKIKLVTIYAVLLGVLFPVYIVAIHFASIVLRDNYQLSFMQGINTVTQNSAFALDLIYFVGLIFTSYFFRVYKQSSEEQTRLAEISSQLVGAELNALKAQLNPHFLFNTLNTIASLIRIDQKAQALKALNELGNMLRKVLENKNNQMVLLKQEVDFIESYLNIQKLRFQNKLITHLDVDENALTAQVPFMFLQPMVENAVQHGSQMDSDQNEVKLEIRRDEQRLDITMVNRMSESETHKGFGIGTSNLKERLEKLYPGNFLFDLSALEGGYHKMHLNIPAVS